ncbi:MAG: ketoacyl-ACP synthase III [Muribaculaceae bacterium]|nr:ketoacyl-ACP synthase III [Muribaculaceae bacterium]
MAYLSFNNVSIRGIAACVPQNVEENASLPFYAPGEAQQVIEAIGIERRHVAPVDIVVSDLCCNAAEQLLTALGWEKESVDLLALVTQNPDYLNHPTSFVVHERMGLPESTMCLDYYHGCPGWVTTLSSVAAMISNGSIKRALLLDGDTVSKDKGAASREERPLFGDGATATAMEFCKGAPSMFFNIGTQSEGGKAIARLQGGYKHPYTLESLKAELDWLAGVSQGDETYKMDSMDVFSFAISKVPKALKRLCSTFEISIEDVDLLVLHQANKMIVDNIAKRLKIPAEKVPYSLKDYGNTTSVSIPLTMATFAAELYRNKRLKNLVCGYGTGLAWAAAYIETENLIIPEIQMI